MSEYNMQCPLAATRLLHSGMPATIEHKSKQRRAYRCLVLGVGCFLEASGDALWPSHVGWVSWGAVRPVRQIAAGLCRDSAPERECESQAALCAAHMLRTS